MAWSYVGRGMLWGSWKHGRILGLPETSSGLVPLTPCAGVFSKCVRSWVLGRSCSPAKLRGAQLSSSCVWQ